MQGERLGIGGDRGSVTYDWAPDGKTILVPLDGDLYLARLDGKVRRLPETEAGELNPTISPNGNHASVVRDGEALATPSGTGAERQIKQRASGRGSRGTDHIVEQAEPGAHTG